MYALQNVSAVAIDVPAVALGAERMKLVISTEAECPACLVDRPGPTAGVAMEAAFVGAKVADSGLRSRTVQAAEYLLEVLSQFRQLLGKLIEGWLGRRASVNARAVAFRHLVLQFWPKF
jgi:hypothetical protein